MVTQMTGMKPKNVIKRKEVPIQENYPPEDVLPENGLYQYLLQPGEEHNDQHKKATDWIWSKATYRLKEVMSSPGNWVMYFLRNDNPCIISGEKAHGGVALLWKTSFDDYIMPIENIECDRIVGIKCKFPGCKPLFIY